MNFVGVNYIVKLLKTTKYIPKNGVIVKTYMKERKAKERVSLYGKYCSIEKDTDLNDRAPNVICGTKKPI